MILQQKLWKKTKLLNPKGNRFLGFRWSDTRNGTGLNDFGEKTVGKDKTAKP
jgi:hypothetical protein